MGKHKKHHKKHSHGHPTPAFPYPTPAFHTPLIPPVERDLQPLLSSPPSLRVSIGLDTLPTTESHESEKHKHHYKSHHHHHKSSNSLPSTSSSVSAGLRDEDHPTIPPLRISLHSSTSSSRVGSSAAVTEELEQRLSELKVSIPLSSLRGAQRSDGEGGGEKGREKHRKKKHKKHKKRHEQEVVQQQQVSGGGKGVPRAEVGGKQVKFGLEGERKSYQVSGGGKGAPRAEVGGKQVQFGLEGERKSYQVSGGSEGVPRAEVGGKQVKFGLEGERKSYQVSGGGKGAPRAEVGGKQFGLEAERKSYGGKGLGAAYQTSPVREDVDPVKGGGGGGMSSVLKTERAHQSHREHQTHPLSQSYTSQTHHSQSLPSQAAHTSQQHSSQHHSSQQSVESRFSDKYYQHKKRMMAEETHTPTTLTPSPAHTSHVTPHTSHPMSPTSHPPEHHKHHKKKKKKHHKHSAKASHAPLSSDVPSSLGGTLLDDGTQTTPTFEVGREMSDLQPPSPVARAAMVVHDNSERGVTVKKIRFSDHTQDDSSAGHTTLSSRQPTHATPTTTPTGKGGRVISEATPPKRRVSSQKRDVLGKLLRLSDSEEEMEGGEESGEGERGREYALDDYDPPPLAVGHLQGFQSPSPQPPHPQVMLSKTSLKMFLANLLHVIQKRDPEGIFTEPVTDDIAPGYSALIRHPMDLSTMATKVSGHAYCGVEEFREDFVLMCKNAMTYNAAETVYYAVASNVMKDGLKIIEKEVSLRPDIRYGRVATPTLSGISQSSRGPSPAHSLQLDYTSPFICRINLNLLQPLSTQSLVVGMETSPSSSLDVLDEVGVAEEQSHLTQVVVGVPPEEGEGDEGDQGDGNEAGVRVSLVTEEEPAEILRQVTRTAEEVKENLDVDKPNTKFCFIQDEPSTTSQQQQQQQDGVVEGRKATMNIINPDSGLIDSSKPLDLSALSERMRAGNNAATVLRTELPMFKATPVSYLMNGPFGSFAPTYDSAFATLTKMDSDLLLHTYGSELGVSYSHSLLQFVKGAGSFAGEMADAVLNSLTAGRHETFMEKYRAWEESLGKTKKEEDHQEKGEEAKESAGEEKEDMGEEKGEDGSPHKDKGKDGDGQEGGGVAEDGEKTGESGSRRVGGKEGVLKGEEDNVDWCLGGEVGGLGEEGSGEMRELGEEGGGEVGELGEEGGGEVDELGEGEVGELDVDEGVMEVGEEGGGDGADWSVTPSRGSSAGVSGSRPNSPDRAMEEEEEEEEGTDESDTSESGTGTGQPSASLSPIGDSDHVSPLSVSDQLSEGANLLSELQTYQWQRLAEPPTLDQEGCTILPAPSREEQDTASQLTSRLVSLTAQVRPRDVVTVSSLHQAMGIATPPSSSPSSPVSPQHTLTTSHKPT